MGGRRPAGDRYPHVTTDAKEADHRYCPVLERVAHAVAAGEQQWGFLHVMPDQLDAADAVDAEKGLYRARHHSGRTCGTQQLSVRVTRTQREDGTWQVAFQVWPRTAAKQNIAGRVARGESLPYNVLRR